MRDRLCMAAFALAAVAFLLVLFSPAPQAPMESAGTRSEEIVNRAQGEANALEADGVEIEELRRRGAALDGLVDGARPDQGRKDALVEEAISRAVEERWQAFHNQLKIIRLYEKKPADGEEPRKGAADAAAAGKTAAPANDADRKPVVKAPATAGPEKAVPVKDARKPDAKPALVLGPWKVVPGKVVEKEGADGKGPQGNEPPEDGPKPGQAEKVEKAEKAEKVEPIEEPEQKRPPPPAAPGGQDEAAKDGAKADGNQE